MIELRNRADHKYNRKLWRLRKREIKLLEELEHIKKKQCELKLVMYSDYRLRDK